MDYTKLLADAVQSSTSSGKAGAVTTEKLAGDASLRQYFRVFNGTDKERYVLLKTESFDAKKYDFLQIQSLLAENGVRVPLVHAIDATNGAILLEDLGDITLLHELGNRYGRENRGILYRKAIDLLVDFHAKINRELPGADCIEGFSLAFDEEKLMWEVNFTIEHLFARFLRRDMNDKTRQTLAEGFTAICQRLENEPRVFTHRDYHARNIMVKDGEYVCIDFQDARMGLRQYDLASLLRDSYFQIDREELYEYVGYYIDRVEAVEKTRLNRQEFFQLFDLASIQRNFKAIGSFAMFYNERGNSGYLRFIGNTFENVRKNLTKFPEYNELLRELYILYYF